MRMDILIKGGILLTPYKVIRDCFVKIEGREIVDFGKLRELDGSRGYETIDGKGKVVMPGLINTHTHASMSLFRSYADDMQLMEWLTKKIWPLEAKLKPEDIYFGALLSIAEMIRTGTTCFNDMYFSMDMVAKAVEESGIRAVLSRGLIGLGGESKSKEGMKEGIDFAIKFRGRANGRIETALGPHAPYTCPPEYLAEVSDKALEHNLPVHIHLAETKGEKSAIEGNFGLNLGNKGIAEYLEDIGFFKEGLKVIAAHCVWLKDKDLDVFKKYDVGVSHNPTSNMKLASGIAPIPSMIRKGISVGIGTDGPASNNCLDMIREMKTTALLHKVNEMDPTVLPADKVIEMATVDGAKVLGLDDVGVIEKGKKADIIMLDLDGVHLNPLNDVRSLIVYAAMGSDVDTVIVDGNIVMEGRRITTLKVEGVKEKTKERLEDLLSR
ncbi:MAG: amidohydrolase, partial [Candidatus Asgardarchaeia archaeon]